MKVKKNTFWALFFILLLGCAFKGSVCLMCANRDYLPLLEKVISKSRKTLYISELYFHEDHTTGRLIFLLNKAVDRGVDIKCILEDSISYNSGSVADLSRIGVQAKLDGEDIFSHAKFIVADGETVIVGSTNLSETSMDRNNETNVLIKDKIIGGWFNEYFLAAWNGEKEPESVSAGRFRMIASGKLSDTFVELFSTVRRRILIIIYGIKIYPDEPDNPVMKVITSLADAQKRGVKTEVVFEISDYNDTLNEMTKRAQEFFEKNGIRTFYENRKTITHAKLVIADDSVVVGSSNWGYGGFKLYREANVLIKDKKLADKFEKYFEKVKQSGNYPQDGL